MEELKEIKKPYFLEKNLRIIYSITLTAIMGVASLSPALPEIQQHFQVTKIQVGYLIMIFTLPGIILTPIMGILADRFGRKVVLVPSLILFGIAGGLCAFTTSFVWLLGLRFLQGIGAASLGSLNVTIIGDLYHGKSRGIAMGYNASILSLGTALYPFLGGFLAQIGWNWPFVLAFMAIPVSMVVLFTLKLEKPSIDVRFSTYLSETLKNIRKKEPLALFCASILSFIILYGAMITYFPFLMKQKFNSSPLTIGLLMSLVSVGSAFTSSNLGYLQSRFTSKKMLLMAYTLYAVACFTIPFVSQLTILVIPIIIFGFAQGANLPNLLTLISNHAPPANRAGFMSTNGMALRTGQTLGPLIMGTLYGIGDIEAVFIGGGVIAMMLFIMIRLIIVDR